MTRVIEVDVDDEVQIQRLSQAISRALPPGIEVPPDKLQEVAIRFVTPRPEEPTGFGAVVRAYDGVRWIRWSADEGPAWISEAGVIKAYADVDVQDKLSDGCPGD